MALSHTDASSPSAPYRSPPSPQSVRHRIVACLSVCFILFMLLPPPHQHRNTLLVPPRTHTLTTTTTHHHPPLKFCADQPTRSFTVHLGGVWCVAVRVLDGFCASAISRTPWRIAASLRLLAAPAPQLPHRHVGRYLHCRLGALCAPVSARRRLRAVVHLALESRLSSLGRAHLPLVLDVILHQYAAASQPINQPTMMCC